MPGGIFFSCEMFTQGLSLFDVLLHLGSEGDLGAVLSKEIQRQPLFLLITNQKGWRKLETLVWRFVVRY